MVSRSPNARRLPEGNNQFAVLRRISCSTLTARCGRLLILRAGAMNSPRISSLARFVPANARVRPCAEWAGDARGHLIPKLEDVSLRALEAVGSQLVPARLENWREN